jgi:hypothetical protein
MITWDKSEAIFYANQTRKRRYFSAGRRRQDVAQNGFPSSSLCALCSMRLIFDKSADEIEAAACFVVPQCEVP